MRTIVIVGSSGGVGRAAAERFTADGHRVIGVDSSDADVRTDLSTAGGRRAMVRDVDELADGAIDGLVVAAADPSAAGPAVVSLDYFGAVAALEGLRLLLEHGTQPRAVVVTDSAATTVAGYPLDIAEWCLAGDEQQARLAASEVGPGAYPSVKLALALWARRWAPTVDWIGHGISLNVVAAGPLGGDGPLPPAGRPVTEDEVAALVAYACSAEAGYLCGSLLTMDGGAEAALRPDAWPRPVDY